MRRFLIALLLLPQLAYAQYHTEEFNLGTRDSNVVIPIGNTFSQDTIITINLNTPIYGLAVSGTATLGNEEDSFVRVTLKDNYNYEFLVYENFALLSDSLTSSFSNTAIETIALDSITPQSLCIELKDAIINLQTISYSASPAPMMGNNIAREHAQYIVNRLNNNLALRNKTWRAGVTSVAEMSFEEKKAMFGGTLPELYGFEYYAGGVFVLPDSCTSQTDRSLPDNTRTNTYASEWDWRNRHGKSWMTGVRNQGGCGSCGVFSAVGALEAYINLYYNQIINYDLSEEEVISCVPNFSCLVGMTQGRALSYIEENGIVPESCFGYTASVQDCGLKCETPTDIVSVGSHHSFSQSLGEDFIKQKLFKSPIPFGVSSWRHAIVLAGYKTIEVGDTIYTGLYDRIVIDSIAHSNIIGRTAWLIKNSWNTTWGNNGYAHIIVDQSNLAWLYYLEGKITSQVYSDSDIICEDADGDGYYFWGIGDKPENCPSWVPDTPDGDDSNINSGPIDEFGFLQELSPDGITINTSQSYMRNRVVPNRIGVVKNGTLKIEGTITMTDSAEIRVCEEGKLIVDGGTINNANLKLIPGCQVIIRNGGKIIMADGKVFDAPAGVVVDVENGEILNYSD